MSFPSRYAGRCSRCTRPIRKGELIDYDRASRKAWHAGATCEKQGELPMEGREPGEIVSSSRRRTTRRRGKAEGVEAPHHVADHTHADVVTCAHCGGSAAGREMVHLECVGGEAVPF